MYHQHGFCDLCVLCGYTIKGIALVWCIAASQCSAVTFQSQNELLQIGKPAVEAQLISVDADGTLEFRVANEPHRVALAELVCWSAPTLETIANQLVFTDGSHLVLADSWSGQPSLTLDDQTVSVTTKLLGKVSLPRSAVRAIFLNAPGEKTEHTRFVDRILDGESEGDRLFLAEGDEFQGRLIGITEDQSILTVRFETELGQIEMPGSRVAAVVCALQQQALDPATLEVGLRDGSRIRARSLVANANQLRLELPDATVLNGRDLRDICSLRSLGKNVCFLSEVEASGYRHVSYLNLPWTYRRNRNVLGGPMRVGGRVYSRGLAMHSASRLTFRLDQPALAGYQRFRAEIALDDVAAKRGSVVFQVYLLRDKKWEAAFTSTVVRGGDAPRSVLVELAEATGLALVTDYADQGDERDYANWLNARLE